MINFPMDSPVVRFLQWLIDTPGLGGRAVGVLFLALVSAYSWTLRWIARGRQGDQEAYAYPTPALHSERDK